jgi:hypothetical protein
LSDLSLVLSQEFDNKELMWVLEFDSTSASLIYSSDDGTNDIRSLHLYKGHTPSPLSTVFWDLRNSLRSTVKNTIAKKTHRISMDAVCKKSEVTFLDILEICHDIID